LKHSESSGPKKVAGSHWPRECQKAGVLMDAHHRLRAGLAWHWNGCWWTIAPACDLWSSQLGG
jgi:hypothetical protein